MEPSDTTHEQSVRKPQRKLNVNGIKTIVVFFAAVGTAMGSAVTGFGAQIAFAPMLTWMLGFSSEKAQGNALRVAIVASIAAVASERLRMVGHFPMLSNSALLLDSLTLFIGATVGVLVASPFAPRRDQITRRRIGLILGMMLLLFVIVQTANLTGWSNPHFANWQGTPLLLFLSILIGAVTKVLELPSGVLLIAALYYLTGMDIHTTVELALIVVALASLLPAISYGKSGIVDPTYAFPALLGGLFGGSVGGLLSVSLSEKAVLFAFALIGMFLTARELAQLQIAPEKGPIQR